MKFEFLNRRQFASKIGLLYFSLNFLPNLAFGSLALRKAYKLDEVEFAPAFLDRYYKWHCKQFYNFEAHLTLLEKKIIKTGFENTHKMERKYPDGAVFPNCLFSHAVSKDSVNSSRVAVGTFAVGSETRNLILDLCKQQKIVLEKNIIDNSPLGISWDVKKNRLKIYADINTTQDIQDQILKKKLEALSVEDYYNCGLMSFVFSNSKLIEKRVHIQIKKHIFSKNPKLAIVPLKSPNDRVEYILSNVKESKYRIESLITNYNLLPNGEQKIVADNSKEFVPGVDSVCYNYNNENIIYFP